MKPRCKDILRRPMPRPRGRKSDCNLSSYPKKYLQEVRIQGSRLICRPPLGAKSRDSGYRWQIQSTDTNTFYSVPDGVTILRPSSSKQLRRYKIAISEPLWRRITFNSSSLFYSSREIAIPTDKSNEQIGFRAPNPATTKILSSVLLTTIHSRS